MSLIYTTQANSISPSPLLLLHAQHTVLATEIAEKRRNSESWN